MANTLYPFKIQVALLISPTESRLVWEDYNLVTPIRSHDEAMDAAERYIRGSNSSRLWGISNGYNWPGREYEKRAVGVKI